jgi:tetratricopeptide (TPR) repeat protein
MPAIRAYLRGERYHRRGEWDSAQVAFEEAVTSDSTFALAWYRLANTLGWKGLYQNPVALRASANAVRFSDSLPPRTRSLLVAYDLFSRGQMAAVDSARSYLQRYPEDADGWYLLGEAQYHGRNVRPLPAGVLREPFDRVIAIDSSLAPAAIHPMEIAIASGDTLLLRRYEAVFRSAGSASEMARAAESRRALSGNDSSLVSLFNATASTGLALAVLHGRFSNPDIDPDAMVRAGSALARDITNPQIGFQARVFPGLLAQALGRTDTALALLRELQTQGQGGDMMLFVQALPIFAGYADSTLLNRVGTMLAQSRQPPNPYVTTWRALIAIDQGRPDEALTLIRPVMANPDTLQRWMRGVLTGIEGLAIVAQGDTARGLAIADSGLTMIGAATSSGFTAPVQLRYAMVLAARPQSRQQAIVRLRDGFTNSPDLYPILQYYLGRTFETAGMADSAAVHYGHFLHLWERADSIYRPITDAARAGLERVTSEPGAARAVPDSST